MFYLIIADIADIAVTSKNEKVNLTVTMRSMLSQCCPALLPLKLNHVSSINFSCIKVH